MDWAALASILRKVAEAGPAVFDGVEKAIPLAKKIGGLFVDGKVPTQADFDEVEATIDAWRAEVDAPLPEDAA